MKVSNRKITITTILYMVIAGLISGCSDKGEPSSPIIETSKNQIVVADVLVDLRFGNEEKQTKAVKILKCADDQIKEAITGDLIELITNSEENYTARAYAISALPSMGQHVSPFVPQLMNYLKTHWNDTTDPESWRICWNIVETLGALGEYVKEHIPLFVDFSIGNNDSSPSVGINILRRMGEHARDAIPLLVHHFNDSKSSHVVRLRAAYTLCHLEKSLPDISGIVATTIPYLIETLEGKHHMTANLDNGFSYEVDLQSMAIRIFEQMGEKAKQAIPLIITLAKKDAVALYALGALAPWLDKKLLPLVGEALKENWESNKENFIREEIKLTVKKIKESLTAEEKENLDKLLPEELH